MRGIAHLAIGILSGAGAAALSDEISLSATGIAIAGISSLVPDLDHPSSKISRNVSIDFRWIKYFLCFLSLLVAGYGYFYLFGFHQKIMFCTAGLGFVMSLFMQENTARQITILFLALLIIATAVAWQYYWLYLLGAFVGISPFLTHRTWTHSVWALLFWYFICFEAGRTLHIQGVVLMGVSGYLSHLLADSLTKNCVKWLYPIYNKSIGIPIIQTGSSLGNFLEISICVIYAILVGALYYPSLFTSS